MSESFGGRLRRQREEQGITLPSIAAHTKIKQSLLEALERDDVAHWPSGIFRRAYVRSYAQAIGLDPDAVAAEFVRVHPDPAEEVTTDAIAAALDETRGRTAPPTRLRYIVGSALGSLTRFGRASAPARPSAPDAGAHARPAGLEPDLPLAPDAHPETAPVALYEEVLETAPRELPIDVALHPDHEEAAEHVPPTGAAWQAHVTWQDDADFTQELEPRGTHSDLQAGEVVEAAPGRDVAVDNVREAATPAWAEDQSSQPAAAAVEDLPPVPAATPDPDLAALAALCTELGQAGSADAVQRSLQQAAPVLEARGLIVWLWDRWADGLRPALAHGYSDAVVAHLPIVGRDGDNVTAAAFRSARPCATGGGADGSGALVVPLLTSGGCAGVLAIELDGGRALMPSVRAAATILAAQLATLAGGPSGAPEVQDDEEAAMDHAVTSR